MPKVKKEVSKCCNAEIDSRGGGYKGEQIYPIIEYCKECNQNLRKNGSGVRYFNPKTNKTEDYD